MAASARRRASSGAIFSALRPISTFSSTDSHGNSAKLWNTMATPSAGPVNALPWYTTSPADGRIRPDTMRSRVDLPQPERPSSPTISPRDSVVDTSSSTAGASSSEPPL